VAHGLTQNEFDKAKRKENTAKIELRDLELSPKMGGGGTGARGGAAIGLNTDGALLSAGESWEGRAGWGDALTLGYLTPLLLKGAAVGGTPLEHADVGVARGGDAAASAYSAFSKAWADELARPDGQPSVSAVQRSSTQHVVMKCRAPPLTLAYCRHSLSCAQILPPVTICPPSPVSCSPAYTRR